MKQAFKSTKMVTMGLFSLCTMGLTNATFAGVKPDHPIELKFIGKIKNQPVFQLNLNNTEAEDFFIVIKDQNHEVLYSEKVIAKDANFTRKYQLDITEADLNTSEFGVRVEVTSAKTHTTQVYKVSSQTSVHEDIVIAQL